MRRGRRSSLGSRGGRIPAALVAAVILAASATPARAQDAGIHPVYPLLDADSVNVLESGDPVSPMTTCGQCHDTGFIAEHSTHTDAGLTGGPEAWKRDASRAPEARNRSAWDWNASGVAEMNCFLCHLPDPATEERQTAIAEGSHGWAATATLASTGIVERADGAWRWNRDAFDEQGRVSQQHLSVQDPASAACGQCHGVVDDGSDGPVEFGTLGPDAWRTLTTGELFSPRRISESALNLAGKHDLTRAWDVHSERLLECADCHYSVNNPAYRSESAETRPDHLLFDGRRMPLGVYLKRPSHYFAGEISETGETGDEAGEGSAGQGCQVCHDPEPVHRWLPQAERHMARLECEVCHTPRLNSVALQVADRTVVAPDGSPRLRLRGADVPGLEVGASDLVYGFEPALLAEPGSGSETTIAPYNLVTSWYWVGGNPPQPIPAEDLEAAFLQDGDYRPEMVTVFDADGDGSIDADELVLDSPERVEAVRSRLISLGWEDPEIRGEIQPYPVHHNVADGAWSTKDCRVCHAESSRLARSVVLAEAVPGGVVPGLVEDGPAELTGSVEIDEDGRLIYRADTRSAGLYVLGRDGVRWANGLGLLMVLGVFAGVLVHAVVRYRTSRARDHEGHAQADVSDVYMYTAYERFWHWLQAIAIILLLLTGIEVHFPEIRLFGFSLAVRVHDIVGFVVIGNAIFAALYHLVSGEIRQYLPEPKGFFGQAIEQGRYYLYGIFKGEPHPFRKSPDRKLNPLQKMTYLAILNVLLPLQMVTGILLWGVQRWPGIEAVLGGLTVLAPVHALGAWSFAAFLLLHVYLTTTGPTPTANVMAMVVGWEPAEATEARMETP